MRELQKRAEALGRAEQRRAVARIVAGLSGKLRGVAVEAHSNKAVLRGKKLLGRWLVDPSLRFIADISR